jgi:hypothetical protein
MIHPARRIIDEFGRPGNDLFRESLYPKAGSS